MPDAAPDHDARRLGAALGAALVALAIAGVALAVAYAPRPDAAHDAVRGQTSWLRGAHAWGASAAVALLALVLARAYLAGPRRAALAALLALGGAIALYQLGTILPWDQQAWEGFQHLRAASARVGVAWGSAEDPGAAPLAIVFWAHVLPLPLALAGLAWARRARVRGDLARLGERRVLLVAAATLAALGALAVWFPPALGPAPIPGLVVSRPHWPFLWLVPLQDLAGLSALLALPLAFLAGAALLLLRRAPSRRARLVTLALVALAWGALTLWGAA